MTEKKQECCKCKYWEYLWSGTGKCHKVRLIKRKSDFQGNTSKDFAIEVKGNNQFPELITQDNFHCANFDNHIGYKKKND